MSGNTTNQDYVGASLNAIQDHYDLSNQFYALWLDSQMLYSSALYLNDKEDLETAQINKLDHHLNEARVGKGKSLLEIGCGWGGLMARAQSRFQLDKVVGLTLSDAQAQKVAELNIPNVTAHVQNWQDHYPEQPYDSIVSIGAFEHFAQLGYNEQQRVDAYRKFFVACRDRFLKDKGFMSLQTFAYGSFQDRHKMRTSESTKFLAEEIFKETDPPHLSNIIEAMQGLFEIVNLRNDRLHYAKTLKEWLQNLKDNRPKAVELVGTAEVEKYERYLRYSYLGFQSGNLDLYRITLRAIEKPWNA